MRAPIRFEDVWFCGLSAVVTLLAASPALAEVGNCSIPFTQMQDYRTPGGGPFRPEQALNDAPGVEDGYRNRYVVLNLNSVGDDGLCKGIQERYPARDDLSAFPDLNTPDRIRHYQTSVQSIWSRPFSQARTINYRGQQLCVGQTLSLCELRGDAPVEIARFVTSSQDTVYWQGQAPMRGYYAPLNIIRRRSWEGNRPYTAADAERDTRTGGVAPSVATGATLDRFKTVIMPNFMNFVPVEGYVGDARNGIHRRVSTEGPGTEADLGVPASLGCLRVTWYGSRFIRWWTPRGARTFIHWDPERYVKHADASGRPVVR